MFSSLFLFFFFFKFYLLIWIAGATLNLQSWAAKIRGYLCLSSWRSSPPCWEPSSWSPPSNAAGKLFLFLLLFYFILFQVLIVIEIYLPMLLELVKFLKCAMNAGSISFVSSFDLFLGAWALRIFEKNIETSQFSKKSNQWAGLNHF